ncbi:MAG: LCP family protein [Defluviitaleaceae bacterium]|nr:LCP family protein [Defluviitaleaceae bacterium]MCL2263478.1 LCP family protein [Defluviitaleaceae bacterium]
MKREMKKEVKKEVKNRTKKKFIVSFGITLAVMLCVMLVGGGVYAGIQVLTRAPYIPAYVEIRPPVRDSDNAGETETPNITESTIMQRKPYFYTFLLFGIDNSNNTDVIMVAALDTVSREAFLVSVPRDTRIETQRRLRKPVSAYAVGRTGGRGHEGGVAELTSDMKSLFGFEPDFYVRIDYAAFERAVDSVGGVTVNVPFHMRYDDPIDNLSINIPAGVQVLNGRQALHFARYRMGNAGFRTITDYERIENQQQIIRALFAQLLSPATITRVPDLIDIYREHVHTNMTYREMLWFGEQLRHLSGATISTYTIPTLGTSGTPHWFEIPCRDGILELVNRTISPFVEDITAEMVNIAQ